MTSSKPKKWLWIFCPEMTLPDVPEIPQIGVKGPWKPDIDSPFNDTLAWDRSGKEFVSESSTAGKTVYRMNFMASEILKIIYSRRKP